MKYLLSRTKSLLQNIAQLYQFFSQPLRVRFFRFLFVLTEITLHQLHHDFCESSVFSLFQILLQRNMD